MDKLAICCKLELNHFFVAPVEQLAPLGKAAILRPDPEGLLLVGCADSREQAAALIREFVRKLQEAGTPLTKVVVQMTPPPDSQAEEKAKWN